jgi:hypothetical protein
MDGYEIKFFNVVWLSSLFPKRSFSFDSKSNAISNGRRNHLECLSDLHVGRVQDKLTSEDSVESKRPFLFGSK